MGVGQAIFSCFSLWWRQSPCNRTSIASSQPGWRRVSCHWEQWKIQHGLYPVLPVLGLRQGRASTLTAENVKYTSRTWRRLHKSRMRGQKIEQLANTPKKRKEKQTLKSCYPMEWYGIGACPVLLGLEPLPGRADARFVCEIGDFWVLAVRDHQGEGVCASRIVSCLYMSMRSCAWRKRDDGVGRANSKSVVPKKKHQMTRATTMMLE